MSNSPRWHNWKLWAAIAALVSALAIFLWLNTNLPRLALFWVFGLAIGFALQRSRFCFVSAISNCVLFRDTRLLEGIMGGLFIATIGFAAIMYQMMPESSPGLLPIGALVTPFGWHLLLGGVMFGFGMMLAGGCIAGNLYRIGEGAISAIVAFLGILLGMGFLQFSWPWWWRNYIGKQSAIWLPAEIGWTGAVALTLLVIIILYVVLRIVRAKASPASTQVTANRTPWSFKLAGIGRSAIKSAWPLALGGIVLGLINVLMYWIVNRPWSITGEVMSWAQGLFNLLRLPPPSMDAVPGT
jgi:uncharacterized membrane protein YedE/YeeE